MELRAEVASHWESTGGCRTNSKKEKLCFCQRGGMVTGGAVGGEAVACVTKES